MAKVQYNPSTLKVSYNPLTGKVQMARPWQGYVPGAQCSLCAVDGTPLNIRITFRDLVDCDSCNHSFRIGKWYKAQGAAAVFNGRLFYMTYSNSCIYYQTGGGWSPLPAGPITMDYYTNNICTAFSYTATYTHTRMVLNLVSRVGDTYTVRLNIDIATNNAGSDFVPVFFTLAGIIVDESGACIPTGILDNILLCGDYVQPGVGNVDVFCTGGYVELEGGGVEA